MSRGALCEQGFFAVEGKMHRVFRIAALAALVFFASKASAQSSIFDFQDGTDQGFGTGFGNDASATFTIANVGGSLRMFVPRTGSFQEAGREGSNPADPYYQAMLAASGNEAGYEISYDWYIDTSPGNFGTFMQLGTYVNTGNGYYAQNFGTPKEVELDGTQLATGGVFSGTVDQTFTAKGFDMPPGQTFFRLGFIVNGNGASQAVYFDNVIIRPVPEPASMALLGLVLPALALRRRG